LAKPSTCSASRLRNDLGIRRILLKFVAVYISTWFMPGDFTYVMRIIQI